MKIKVSILLITSLMISFSAFSQIKFGLTAGTLLTSTNISTSTFDFGQHYSVQSSSDKIGFQGGIMAQILKGDLFFQPEVLLSATSSKIQIFDGTKHETNFYLYQKYTTLSIPVIVGYKIGMFRVGGGPSASFVLSNKPSDPFTFSDPNLPANIKFNYHTVTLDYQLGIGLDVWKLAFDLKYQGNITKFGNGMTITETEGSTTSKSNFTFDTRVNQWILGIGFYF